MATIEAIGGGGWRSLAWIILIVCVSPIAMSFVTVGLTRFVVSVGQRFSFGRKIQGGFRRSGSHSRYELRFMTLNAALVPLMLGFTGYLWSQGVIVVPVSGAGLTTVLLECIAYVAGLDAYAYLIHRLMHTRFLFRHVHYVHHRSKTPSPLSGFSFHPVEWIVLGLYFPLALWILRPHLVSVALIGLLAPFLSTFTHCGHDYAPPWWYTNRLAKYVQTPFFHDVHHQTSNHNFGAVTTVWDHLFGTVAPDFERRFMELNHRDQKESESHD